MEQQRLEDVIVCKSHPFAHLDDATLALDGVSNLLDHLKQVVEAEVLVGPFLLKHVREPPCLVDVLAECPQVAQPVVMTLVDGLSDHALINPQLVVRSQVASKLLLPSEQKDLHNV